MSQYVSFYIRTNDTFTEFYTENIHGKLGQFFADVAPWEKIKRVTPAIINRVRDDIHQSIKDCDRQLNFYNTMLATISQFNNDIDEKIEATQNTLEEIQSYQDSKQRFFNALAQLEFIEEMMDYMDIRDHDDVYSIAGIYFGCETPDSVTVIDVVGEYK